MAASLIVVTFAGTTYLALKKDFERRPNPNQRLGSARFYLPPDAKLVPIAGGEPVAVWELTPSPTNRAKFDKLCLFDEFDKVMEQHYESVYWNAIAKSQDPSHRAERLRNAGRINGQILNDVNQYNRQLNNLNCNNGQQNRTYAQTKKRIIGQQNRTYAQTKNRIIADDLGVMDTLGNTVLDLESNTQRWYGGYFSSEDYDVIIQCMQNIIAKQKSLNLVGRQTLDTGLYRYFNGLKDDIWVVRYRALYYLEGKLAGRGMNLCEMNLLWGNVRNISLNQLNEQFLRAAGFDPYSISRMLAVKNVVTRMEACEKLCYDALGEYQKIHQQLNLADFYTPEQLKQLWGPCGGAPMMVPFQPVPGQNVWMQQMPFQMPFQMPMNQFASDDDSRASTEFSNHY